MLSSIYMLVPSNYVLVLFNMSRSNNGGREYSKTISRFWNFARDPVAVDPGRLEGNQPHVLNKSQF
uniref:Uncharacterized protein n=1 Tax=Arundo donax TaxID=35708 RepID=A0A0A9HKX4_ARUDO